MELLGWLEQLARKDNIVRTQRTAEDFKRFLDLVANLAVDSIARKGIANN